MDRPLVRRDAIMVTIVTRRRRAAVELKSAHETRKLKEGAAALRGDADACDAGSVGLKEERRATERTVLQ